MDMSGFHVAVFVVFACFGFAFPQSTCPKLPSLYSRFVRDNIEEYTINTCRPCRENVTWSWSNLPTLNKFTSNRLQRYLKRLHEDIKNYNPHIQNHACLAKVFTRTTSSTASMSNALLDAYGTLSKVALNLHVTTSHVHRRDEHSLDERVTDALCLLRIILFDKDIERSTYHYQETFPVDSVTNMQHRTCSILKGSANAVDSIISNIERHSMFLC